MHRRAIVAIVTRNHIAQVRSLMKQCVRHEPGVDRFVFFVDDLPQGCMVDVAAHPIRADDLGVTAWRRFAFQYTPFEVACALKPWAIDHVLTNLGYQSVIYLDGDMGLYGPLTRVWETLETESIVLTPHLLRPAPDDGLLPTDSIFMRCGAFNAGLIGVRGDEHGQAFSRWWKSKLAKQCIVDLAGGLFVDQKWLDMVPGLFPGVHVLRDFGINAGHWSLAQVGWSARPTKASSTSDLFVGPDPLVLFHFSGMTIDAPHRYRESQTRTRINTVPGLQQLIARFHADVRAAGLDESARWGCKFDRLSDGTPIEPAWREAIRREHVAFADIDDPFDVAARPELLARFRSIESSAVRWRMDWRLNGSGGLRFRDRVRVATRAVRILLGAA